MSGNSVHDNALIFFVRRLRQFGSGIDADSVGDESAAPGSAAKPTARPRVLPRLPAINSGTAAFCCRGATAEIDGISAQSVTFEGSTGTLKLDDARGIYGSGLGAGWI